MTKSYNMYDVLIGMFNFFPEEMAECDYNNRNFNEFFFNRRENYSILNHVAFDNDGNFPESKELDDACGVMRGCSLISPSEDPSKNTVYLPAIKFAFEKFSKNRFNEREISELEILSREFHKKFC
jgi:hypothetical protein